MDMPLATVSDWRFPYERQHEKMDSTGAIHRSGRFGWPWILFSGRLLHRDVHDHV